MMNRIRGKVLPMMLLTLCAGLAFCAEGHAEASSSGFRAVIASDLHYIAPELTDGGPGYQQTLKNGDSKFMPYVEEITDAFLDEVLLDPPDVVLLTGDLTFNGAEISHRRLAGKLQRLEDAGIPVLVLPGNHDVYNENAARYRGGSFERVPFADSESFAEIYRDFGPGEALSADSDSLSYVWQLNEQVWIMMLDEDTAHDFCGLSDRSFQWIEAQLQKAREEGRFVLVAGHQNVFQHSIFRGGYVIQGAQRLQELLRRYGVPLCLSGHLHTQHVLSEDGLTEIATSALCSYPCQYAVLTAEDGRLRYGTRRLDLAAWAERNGRPDAVFQDFAGAAGAYMDAHFTPAGMAPLVDDPVLWAEMLAYLQALNRAYFSGDLREIAALDPDGRLAGLWAEENGMTAWYLRSVLDEEGNDHTVWQGDYA
ncbi:MAG: metallophosphoesterase [Oscillospiraceae bacterium]|nr:metallophosphoesterase [Oscillospiraceae bacterium]